ncbi:hypothetical protein LCGC14_1402930 [marine sediment metagenome]|uniref:Uncharacterized protein n=1 Tax=marine sediment metagenome TaxID=412755 RepID=A0A0F9MY28_9ZZZZ
MNEEKLGNVIDALYGHFEEKSLKESKLAFVSYIMNIALEKTNHELEQMNMMKFLELHNNKHHYSDEFKEAMVIFENNLREYLEKIIHKLIKGMWEDK